MSRDEANQLLQAIEDDPWLLPEAKEHLAHQYALLLRVGSEDRRDTLRPAAREKRYRTASHARPRAVDPVAEAEVLEDVERAAAENPNGPRGRQRKR